MEIMLRVEKSLCNGQYKEQYRNTVKVSDGITPPFEKLLDGLSLLYPNCVYHFTILHYQSLI